MSTDTREALAALTWLAAECAQRKPLRAFEERLKNVLKELSQDLGRGAHRTRLCRASRVRALRARVARAHRRREADACGSPASSF